MISSANLQRSLATAGDIPCHITDEFPCQSPADATPCSLGYVAIFTLGNGAKSPLYCGDAYSLSARHDHPENTGDDKNLAPTLKSATENQRGLLTEAPSCYVTDELPSESPADVVSPLSPGFSAIFTTGTKTESPLYYGDAYSLSARHGQFKDIDDDPCEKLSQPFHSYEQLVPPQIDIKVDSSRPSQSLMKTCDKVDSINVLKPGKSQNVNLPFICWICRTGWPTEQSLIAHMKGHRHERPYKCCKCQAKFKFMKDLKVHMVVHATDVRPYKCGECMANFKSKNCLNQHIITHSGERPYKCSECGANFKCKSNMESHMVVHSDLRPHECSECKAKFKRKYSLYLHKRSHSGERPYKCSNCVATFKWRSGLYQHMKTYSVDKPHKCSECEADFKSKKSLDFHMLVHSDARPYRCGECKATFKSKRYLKLHMIVHSDVRSFSCSECELMFKSRDSLTKHMKIHKGGKPVKCNQCLADFRRKPDLKKHMKIHDGGENFDNCPDSDANLFHRGDWAEILGDNVLDIQATVKLFSCREYVIESSSVNHLGKIKNTSAVCIQQSDHTYQMKIPPAESNASAIQPCHPTMHLHDGDHTYHKGPYRCEVCDVSFFHERALKNHINSR